MTMSAAPVQGLVEKKNLLKVILGFLFGWLPFGKKDSNLIVVSDDSDVDPLPGTKISFRDRISDWGTRFGIWLSDRWNSIVGVFHRDESTEKPARTAKSSEESLPLKTRITTFFVAVTRSRWVFWGGFWLISFVILLIGRERGIILYNGDFYKSYWAGIVQPFMFYGEFVVFAIGYVFAMPMDTIPGKGKFFEFLGDVIVASTFFFLFRLSSPLFWAVEVFIQNKENVTSVQHQLIMNLMETVRYNALLWVISMVLILAILRFKKWRTERSGNSPKKPNKRQAKK